MVKGIGPMDVSKGQLWSERRPDLCHILRMCYFTALLLGGFYCSCCRREAEAEGTTAGNQLCLRRASIVPPLREYSWAWDFELILFLMYMHLHHHLPLGPGIDGFLLSGIQWMIQRLFLIVHLLCAKPYTRHIYIIYIYIYITISLIEELSLEGKTPPV